MAFVVNRQNEGAALCVFRGEAYLQISVFRMGAADMVLPGVKELAQTALLALTNSNSGEPHQIIPVAAAPESQSR